MDANLHKGMKTHSPKAEDASTKLPTSSSTVNSEPTRGKTATTPRTLGPRTA